MIPQSMSSNEQEATTIIFLVRHAEKMSDGSADPALAAAGTARAEELAYILKNVELSAIYSTPYRRTQQTVFPTAKAKDLEVRLYDPGDKSFLEKIIQTFAGGSVLIVGHSNTIPVLANELAGRSGFVELDDDAYDNLFIACVPAEGKPVILWMRYGAHTPKEE